MDLVRLTLTDRDGEYDNMYLDAFVRDGVISDQFVTYGKWGDFDGEPWMFALRPPVSGNPARIDFGSEFDTRFGSLNLHGKKLKRGELATFKYEDDEVCFSISDARKMPDGEDAFLTGA